jgi:hypothetical protein
VKYVEVRLEIMVAGDPKRVAPCRMSSLTHAEYTLDDVY